MTEYIVKTDKNGKSRYYKLVDGKMKTVSRAEYEANTAETEVVETEATVAEIETTCTALAVPFNLEALFTGTPSEGETSAEKPEDVALTAVKGIVSGMGLDEAKVKLQVLKHSVLVNYRNCMVCSLVFDENRAVTAIRFMGTTLETRKKVTVCEPVDLRSYTDRISEQVTFIDWWWLNSAKKKTA